VRAEGSLRSGLSTSGERRAVRLAAVCCAVDTLVGAFLLSPGKPPWTVGAVAFLLPAIVFIARLVARQCALHRPRPAAPDGYYRQAATPVTPPEVPPAWSSPAGLTAIEVYVGLHVVAAAMVAVPVLLMLVVALAGGGSHWC